MATSVAMAQKRSFKTPEETDLEKTNLGTRTDILRFTERKLSNVGRG